MGQSISHTKIRNRFKAVDQARKFVAYDLAAGPINAEVGSKSLCCGFHLAFGSLFFMVIQTLANEWFTPTVPVF